MMLIRKPWRLASALSLSLSLTLTLVVGCSSDETNTTAAPPAAATPAGGPSASPEKRDETKDLSTAEGKGTKAIPASDKKDGSTTPAASTPSPDAGKKDDMPKIEAPKVEPATSAATPVKLSDKEVAEIKKLPADEAAVALKQAVCPVSGGHLGEMGKPYKISAEGKTFYLCCDACVDKVKEDPKAVIAKLAGK